MSQLPFFDDMYRTLDTTIGPPPGLYKSPFVQAIPPETTQVKSKTYSLLEIKSKLEIEMIQAQQKVISCKVELTKINELISAEKKIIQLTHTYNENIVTPQNNSDTTKTPTPEFIQAINNLFLKESPIQLSNIPHKLPANVLPPKGQSGLFTSWLEQVPHMTKNSVKTQDRVLHYYHIDTTQDAKLKVKKCWQAQRSKPCNNLNENGKCKFCN